MAESGVIHLAAENSPIEAAWAAFDFAAIRLNRLYADASPTWDTPTERDERASAAIEAARLWREWQTLFLADDGGPGEAA